MADSDIVVQVESGVGPIGPQGAIGPTGPQGPSVSDGDKGDVTVSGSGAAWTVDDNAISYGKMQDVSATSRLLGRKTAGSGDPEELTISEALDFLTVGTVAQGDVIIRGASSWLRLAPGASGQFLKTLGAGQNAAWATVSATTLLDQLGVTHGDLLYRGASGWQCIGIQAAGLVLTSMGAGAAPAWQASTGGGGGSGTPGGSDTEIQFNDSSSFGGDANLTWVAGLGMRNTQHLSLGTAANINDGVYGPGDPLRGGSVASAVGGHTLTISDFFAGDLNAIGAGSIIAEQGFRHDGPGTARVNNWHDESTINSDSTGNFSEFLNLFMSPVNSGSGDIGVFGGAEFQPYHEGTGDIGDFEGIKVATSMSGINSHVDRWIEILVGASSITDISTGSDIDYRAGILITAIGRWSGVNTTVVDNYGLDIVSHEANTPANANIASNVNWNIRSRGGGSTNAFEGQLLLGSNPEATITRTTNFPPISIKQTWNNGGVHFDTILIDMTSTASGNSSNFLNCKVDGSTGFIVYTDGTIATQYGSGVLGYDTFAGDSFGVSEDGPKIIAPLALRWSSSSGLSGADDVLLYRDAAGVLAQRNGASAQALRVYNTYTDASNYERGGFDWAATANTLRIRSENAGTGTNRIIAIDGFAKAGAAVAADIPAGTWALVRDTSGLSTKLVYNDAGTLMTVALT